MIAAGIFAILWALACLAALGGVLWKVWSEDFGDGWPGNLIASMVALFIAAFASFLGTGPLALMQYSASPDLATLKKHEWACTDEVQTTTYIANRVGDVTVMQPVTTSECVNYSKVL